MERGALKVINGDARIADKRIAEALGYARVKELHQIIGRHSEELERYGELVRQSSAGINRQSEAKIGRGRPALTYYLNEAQATLVCMFSRTPRAADARQVMVEVFTAWRKGQIESVAASSGKDPFARAADRAIQVRDQMQALADMPALARDATHLPVWTSGLRPWWWSNFELRTFFTQCHRQMTLSQCVEAADRRFGLRVSVSGLQRYWAKLDQATGAATAKRARRRRAA
ncbi:MAG: hypothetical protein KBF78_17225 [Fuscovulum sp.]|nr:hypothetical protein [Fuscovulum sp.]